MAQNESTTDYRELLQRELADRKAANPAYSLRAFARDLKVNPATLSQTLNRKRKLSLRNAHKIADHLSLSPEEIKSLFGPNGRAERSEYQYLNFAEDRFRLVSDWYFLAILSLARIPTSRSDPKWIARRLGISVYEVKAALTRLKRMRLIKVNRGKLKRTALPLMTGHDISSSAFRKHQKQNLKLAELSIDRDPLSIRENSSVTMAIDPRRINEAKHRILKFKKSLSNYLEKGEPSEVYTLAIQLFPTFNGKERL